MKLAKLDYLYFLLLFICSLIFVSDFFLHSGKPATFDAATHIATIAQYSSALKAGNFPVVWLGGLGNYGLPIGIVAHQMTSYLGAVINLVINNPTISLNIVAFLGIFLSTIFFYRFLRLYLTADIAFVSTFFFNFSSYRILNFYIRGAIPELVSNLFLPLILIALFYCVKKTNIKAFLLLIFSFLGLALNHPMMLLIYSFIYVPYLFFLLFFDSASKVKTIREKLFLFVSVVFSMGLGVAMASYYLFPLFLEIKYFYFGLSGNHLTPNSYLSLSNYFDASWYRFNPQEIYTRGQIITVGILNSIVVILGVIYFLFQRKNKKTISLIPLLGFLLILSVITIFFTSSFSSIFYNHINILSNIQFPWRMLSSFIFLPPIILGILLTSWSNRYVYLFVIFAVSLMSFSQLFGKDYERLDQSKYYFMIDNPHSIMMNTIWTGKTDDYPVQKRKSAIIAGQGSIISQQVSNTKRTYKIEADSNVRMVDYTFYFPGWQVRVDNSPVPIEFQDPKYRGVITYNVPSGNHTVVVEFMNTKVRALGNMLSLGFIVLTILLLSISWKYNLVRYLLKSR